MDSDGYPSAAVCMSARWRQTLLRPAGPSFRPPTESNKLLAQARILEQKREQNGGDRQRGHDHHRGGDANEVTDEACLRTAAPLLIACSNRSWGLPARNVLIRLTFEPSTGLRRQILGEPCPRRLSRKVGWQKRASCTDTAKKGRHSVSPSGCLTQGD